MKMQDIKRQWIKDNQDLMKEKDYHKINGEWLAYIDMLCKDKQISEYQYNRASGIYVYDYKGNTGWHRCR